MVDAEGRRFRRYLAMTLGLLGLLTAGSVLLFGHLLFKSLSKDVVSETLLRSRREAERIASGVAERAGGNLYTLRYKQTEIDSFVGGSLAERQVVNEVEVRDKAGRVLYQFGGAVKQLDNHAPGSPEGGNVGPLAPGTNLAPSVRSYTTTYPVADPYSIEVPIGDFGVLRVGVSRRELEGRVEKLRRQLYLRTFAAASVSLLGIGAAAFAILLLVQRTRRVEEAHREAERRAELGEVAAGLAHEIRNPLNAMSLNLELLEEHLQRVPQPGNGGPPERVQAAELAEAARQETGRLGRLLTDFLAYARPSPLSPVPADLNEPAAEAVAFLRPEAEKRGIRLDFTPHPGGAEAKLDVPRVKQVVLNLLGNALDAVESEGATAREVSVRVEAANGAWRLVVRDRGPGLREQDRKELFKLFVSTKPAGTGLGLPIADRIVRGHGGTLTISSSEGEPTTAVATFPRG